MPVCAEFVDELREVFGAEEVNQVIRVGLKSDCRSEQQVYFSERGEVLGNAWVPSPGRVVNAAQMVLGTGGSAKGGRRGNV